MKLRDIIRKHLLTEGRTRRISRDKALELYTSGNFARRQQSFFRGIHSDFNYGFIKPRNHVRTSANTKNYYTLILDNSSAWSEYPNRSNSIVCTTSESTSSVYGETYRVFPRAGYKLGICSSNDIWNSFSIVKEILETQKYLGLSALNDTIDDIIANAKGNAYKLEEHPSYPRFRSILESIEFSDIESIMQGSNNLEYNSISLINYWSNNKSVKNFYSLLERILDPKSNHFEVINTVTNKKWLSSRNEVWTDAPSLLVKEKIFEEFVIEANS